MGRATGKGIVMAAELMSGTIQNLTDETFELVGYYGDWEGKKPDKQIAPGKSTVFSCEGIMSAKANAEYVAKPSGVRLGFSIGINTIQKGAGWAVPTVSQTDVFNVYPKAGRRYAEFVVKNWPE